MPHSSTQQIRIDKATFNSRLKSGEYDLKSIKPWNAFNGVAIVDATNAKGKVKTLKVIIVNYFLND